MTQAKPVRTKARSQDGAASVWNKYKYFGIYALVAAAWFAVEELVVVSLEDHHEYNLYFISSFFFVILSMSGAYILYLHLRKESSSNIRMAEVQQIRAQRALDAFALVTDIDRAIMGSTNLANIYQHTCNRLVKNSLYCLAWIGEPEQGPGKRVIPVCSAGPMIGYLEGLTPHWGNSETGFTLSGKAINSMTSQVLNNISSVKKMETWHKRLISFGIGSTTAVPIIVSGRVFAVLRVYSTKNDAFHVLEKYVLEILAEHLSYAIRSVDGISEIKKAVDESNTLKYQLSNVLMGTITALSRTIEARDPYTAGHQQSVANISVAIGQKLNLSVERLDVLRLGAMIHDIGKVGVPADILTKPSKLSVAEFAIIKEHPIIGFNILEQLDNDTIKRIVVEHHERMDGSGYPKGLTKDMTLLESRIVSVADVVDSVTRHRPYRAALGIEKAREILHEGNGHLFDPMVVSAFDELFYEGYDFVATYSETSAIPIPKVM